MSLKNSQVNLIDVAEIIMGQSPKGVTYNKIGEGVPLLNGPTEFGPSHPTPALWTTAPTRLCKEGDILFCVRGSTTGRMNWADREYCLGRGIGAFRARTDKIDTRYIYYTLVFELPRLLSLCVGSVFPNLSRQDFSRFSINWHDKYTRSAIASILGALDDKIELNSKMNETLEAMARAIFKSWFVDFDPIPGLSPHKEWQDSPLGKIPKGWRVGSIGNIIELAYGKALKEDVRQLGKIPVYGSNGQVGWHNEKLVDGPGIVVGRKGNPGIIKWVTTDFYPIDTTFYIVPKGLIKSMLYLFHALKLQDLPSLGADSAVPGLNRNMAYMNKMLVPSPDIVSAFDDQVKPLAEKINQNINQSRTIAAIRDALLPKLLSGEIRVKDAERFVEVAS